MSGTDQAVLFSKQGSVGVITINNPPVNALRQAVRAGIAEGVQKFAADSSVSAIVLIEIGRAHV